MNDSRIWKHKWPENVMGSMFPMIKKIKLAETAPLEAVHPRNRLERLWWWLRGGGPVRARGDWTLTQEGLAFGAESDGKTLKLPKEEGPWVIDECIANGCKFYTYSDGKVMIYMFDGYGAVLSLLAPARKIRMEQTRTPYGTDIKVPRLLGPTMEYGGQLYVQLPKASELCDKKGWRRFFEWIGRRGPYRFYLCLPRYDQNRVTL